MQWSNFDFSGRKICHLSGFGVHQSGKSSRQFQISIQRFSFVAFDKE
eukprot:12150.XXX_442497_442637_1 [CDS] Oithona nana genome sequencing.